MTQLRPIIWVRLIFPAVLMVVGAQDLGEALIQRGWEHPGYLVAAALFFAVTWLIGASLLTSMNRTDFTVEDGRLLLRRSGGAAQDLPVTGTTIELDPKTLRLVGPDGAVLFRSARFLWSPNKVREFASATGLKLVERGPARG